MAYTDELFRVVDEYFMEIIMPYGRTNAEAGEYLKKFKPFQRKTMTVICSVLKSIRRKPKL